MEAIPEIRPACLAPPYFLGIDVGTGSVRAALVSKSGNIIRTRSRETQTWNPKVDFYEQSSTDIWYACCSAVKALLPGIHPTSVIGIGVDATCSLVVLDKKGNPLSISQTGENYRNVILWMDHRAKKETELINNTKSKILNYVGGKMSPEMEIPKLMWIKKHLKSECWDNAGLFFDLPDFLTWKMTGSEDRSLCSLVCKWTYEIKDKHILGWNKEFFDTIELGDLSEENWRKIGSRANFPGRACGILTAEAAKDLGLLEGAIVSTSIIDAHAGGVGMIGCHALDISEDLDSRLCIIAGTSTCHMAVNQKPVFVEGVWGPYFGAMIPNLFLNEGGQSAAGKLIDHIIETHPASKMIKDQLESRDSLQHIHEYLNELLRNMKRDRNSICVAMLTENLHVYPDFHGNRSPLADSSLSGMISGLSLAADEENLALLYLATIQALAYGTLHIVETMKKAGYKTIQSVVICGGLSQNKLYVETHADVLGMPVLLPLEKECVMLGSAILAATAFKEYPDVQTAIKSMTSPANIVAPRQIEHMYHQKKYKVFQKMIKHQKRYKVIMDD